MQSNVFSGPFGLTAAGVAEALGYTPLNKAGDGMTGALTIAQAAANVTPFSVSGYSLTGANQQALAELAGTWNTTGTPTAINLVITDTASPAASRFMRFTLGSSVKWTVDKFGNMVGPGANAVVSGWGVLGLTDGISAPGATAGMAKLYVDTADGDLKIVFGDGTVKTIVVDT